ncbi:MAG: MarR family winged helix-turn-helix transcriptional regulator [Hydrogeniiclostridium sp.]
MSQLSISAREAMNRFLIEDFNYILRAEEKALSAYGEAGLSVNEFHIIESVIRAEKEEQNTMGEISRRLGVTMGTLTTAVKTLEKKGCLLRRRSAEDKRVVRLEATDKGKEADRYHQRFHAAMVEAVASCLSEEQMVTLTGALSLLAGYFSHYSRGRGDFPSEGEREPWLSPQLLGENAEQAKNG